MYSRNRASCESRIAGPYAPLPIFIRTQKVAQEFTAHIPTGLASNLTRLTSTELYYGYIIRLNDLLGPCSKDNRS